MRTLKRIYKEDKGLFLIWFVKHRVIKHWWLAFSGGPEGFRELRGACWSHFHLSWYPSDAVVPNCSQKGGGPSTVYWLATR